MDLLEPKPGALDTGVGSRRWIELSDLDWKLVFLIYTVAGVIAAGSVFTSGLAEGAHQRYYYPLMWEMTGYWSGFALVPLLVMGFARLPVTRENWPWMIPCHVVISIGFGLAHTLMMLGSRHALYALFDLGRYEYGHFGYRVLMEYHKQFLHYWAVYAVLRGVAYYRQSREQERAAAALELKTSELQRRLAEAQLQGLRSQLNPHFLFNTLNMISSVMYENVDRADHMIAALSRMLRMSLEENVKPQVPLRRELEFIDCAVELIRARFQDQVDIQVECAPDALDCLVPGMLLHNLLENAIKHNSAGENATIHARVRIERDERYLHLHVLDNGPGIESLETALGKGVGLSNSQQRLQALYGTNFKLALENRPEGGLHAHVAIPAQLTAALQPA
jgi:signal transduction histidine kinase